MHTFVEVVHDIFDECAQLFKGGSTCEQDATDRRNLTSAVQAPELDGWKKLSTVAISLARLSSALEPARYVFIFPCPPLPNGAER